MYVSTKRASAPPARTTKPPPAQLTFKNPGIMAPSVAATRLMHIRNAKYKPDELIGSLRTSKNVNNPNAQKENKIIIIRLQRKSFCSLSLLVMFRPTILLSAAIN